MPTQDEQLDEIISTYWEDHASSLSDDGVPDPALKFKSALQRMLVEARIDEAKLRVYDFTRGESSEAFDEGRSYEHFKGQQRLAELQQQLQPKQEGDE